MDKQTKVLWIPLLGSCVLLAAWAQQAGLPIPWPAEALGASSRTELAQPQPSPSLSTVYPTTQRATTAGAHSTTRRTPGDIDGDGKSDLLFDNIALGQTAYWRMDGTTPVAYSPAFTKPEGHAQAASGDFNGDGKLDIVWARASDRTLLLWLGGQDGFTAIPIRDYSTGWAVTGAGDINGDGKSDLLLANAAQGLFAYWVMDGAVPVRYSPAFTRPAGHAQVATGDFNADGKLDIVWADPAIRTLLLWQGDGDGFVQAPIRGYAEGWAVTGAGDVDGDGRSDLLLTNVSLRYVAYWTMDGAAPRRYSPAFAQPVGYRPVTYGDYNGDGKLDLVLARVTDRTLLLWRGDGNGFTEAPIRDYTPGWQVVRDFSLVASLSGPYVRGDVNGDGKGDLAFFGLNNDVSSPGAPGQYFYRVMDGPRIESTSATLSLRCSNARPVAAGDFNGDGKTDFVFDNHPKIFARDCALPETYVRLSAGDGFTEVALPHPAPGWSIVGAGDVNGDGRSDLVLNKREPSAIAGKDVVTGFAYWIMDGGVVSRYSPGFLSAGDKKLATKGDFNGDGKLDLVWSGSDDAGQTLLMWLGDGNGFTEVPVPRPAKFWSVFAAGDIDGDGSSDLLFYDRSSGPARIAYWIMEGNTPIRYSPIFSSQLTAAVVTGDYNGDGKLDLVLEVPLSSSRFSTVPMQMWLGDGHGFSIHEIGDH
ncbi:MAG: VCBS repeat-containing protein, partial [Chloroflexota bacterium]|nr:VCBS repeat-containing protein [Chloroflexota bacterium]